MTEQLNPWVTRLFALAAVVGVVGWLFLLAVWAWWTIQPANLPSVTEPIEVLNPNNEVAINTTLFLSLEVVKPKELNQSGSVRFLECQSGNLVTLTPSQVRLPAGEYTVISDTIVIPAKVTPGDTCVAVFEITYQVNPIREEIVRFDSEAFRVLPATTTTLP